MKHYVVAALKIDDEAWVPEYVSNVAALVEKHGGRYLARGGNLEKLEGEGAAPHIAAIIEWPSKEAAEAFYSDPDYQPYLQSRLAGASGDLLLIEGDESAGA